MSKRRPDAQITQENWNDEEEVEEVGVFQKANDNEMKNRVIRVAKRRIARSSDQLDSSDTAVKPSSVFSGFSLLPTKSVGEIPSGSKPLFNFGSTPASSTFSFSSTIPASVTSAITQPKANDNDTENSTSNFESKLKDLNKAVFDTIKGHIDNGKLCIFTPIFNDYEKYVKELQDEKDKKSSTNHKNSISSTPSFSFSAPKSSATAETNATGAAIATASTKSNFSAPSFSFSKPAASFGSTAVTGKTGFTFASAIQQASKAPENNEQKTDAANGNTEADDESDEPPKVEFVPVVEDESIYSKRCKVFVKDDADFKDRGTGTLYLKSVQGGKIQLIVRADTNLGNILLNILLTASVPAKRLKNNVVLVCIPTPDADPKPKSVLVRVKTEDDATELLEEIQKHQK